MGAGASMLLLLLLLLGKVSAELLAVESVSVGREGAAELEELALLVCEGVDVSGGPGVDSDEVAGVDGRADESVEVGESPALAVEDMTGIVGAEEVVGRGSEVLLPLPLVEASTGLLVVDTESIVVSGATEVGPMALLGEGVERAVGAGFRSDNALEAEEDTAESTDEEEPSVFGAADADGVLENGVMRAESMLLAGVSKVLAADSTAVTVFADEAVLTSELEFELEIELGAISVGTASEEVIEVGLGVGEVSPPLTVLSVLELDTSWELLVIKAAELAGVTSGPPASVTDDVVDVTIEDGTESMKLAEVDCGSKASVFEEAVALISEVLLTVVVTPSSADETIVWQSEALVAMANAVEKSVVDEAMTADVLNSEDTVAMLFLLLDSVEGVEVKSTAVGVAAVGLFSAELGPLELLTSLASEALAVDSDVVSGDEPVAVFDAVIAMTTSVDELVVLTSMLCDDILSAVLKVDWSDVSELLVVT